MPAVAGIVVGAVLLLLLVAFVVVRRRRGKRTDQAAGAAVDLATSFSNPMYSVVGTLGAPASSLSNPLYAMGGNRPSAYEAAASDASLYSAPSVGNFYGGGMGEGSAYAEVGPHGGIYAVATNRRINPLFAEGDDCQDGQVPYSSVDESRAGYAEWVQSKQHPEGAYAEMPGAATGESIVADGGYMPVSGLQPGVAAASDGADGGYMPVAALQSSVENTDGGYVQVTPGQGTQTGNPSSADYGLYAVPWKNRAK